MPRFNNQPLGNQPLENQPLGVPAGNREAAGGQALVITTAALAGSNLILLLTAFLIATQIQHRRVLPAPPSSSLLLVFYAVGLLCLLAALRPRFRTLGTALLPHKEFSPQVFTCIGLANVCLYLGMIWVILGGAFLPSVPLFAGPTLVILLFVLPVVRKRASLLKSGV
jgi:hypothetical protein